jgi:hypothetical protein
VELAMIIKFFPPSQLADPTASRCASPVPTAAAVDVDEIERLAYGYGLPSEPILSDVRRLWWRLRQLGVPLPVERRVIRVTGALL